MTIGQESTPWKRRLPWLVSGALWLAASAAGLEMLTRYSNSPGALQPGPSNWPAHSKLQPSSDRCTLVLFAHPHCPCTRATLGELERIVARYGDAVTPWVVFLKPSGTDDNWEETDLWRSAAAIPGVRVASDADGAEARRFHAGTSGQTLLYNSRGELLFDGGITFARGHSGDNAGRSAIESWLAGHSPGYSRTPVFGCPIAATTDEKQGAQ